MLRFLTAGESHGPGLVTIVEGPCHWVCLEKDISTTWFCDPSEVLVHPLQVIDPNMHAVGGVDQIECIILDFGKLHAVITLEPHVPAMFFCNGSSMLDLILRDVHRTD